jgi:hypothetical protein
MKVPETHDLAVAGLVVTLALIAFVATLWLSRDAAKGGANKGGDARGTLFTTEGGKLVRRSMRARKTAGGDEAPEATPKVFGGGRGNNGADRRPAPRWGLGRAGDWPFEAAGGAPGGGRRGAAARPAPGAGRGGGGARRSCDRRPWGRAASRECPRRRAGSAVIEPMLQGSGVRCGGPGAGARRRASRPSATPRPAQSPRAAAANNTTAAAKTPAKTPAKAAPKTPTKTPLKTPAAADRMTSPTRGRRAAAKPAGTPIAATPDTAFRDAVSPSRRRVTRRAA